MDKKMMKNSSKKMMMKNGAKKMGKKVMSHLKEDMSEFREGIKEDKILMKSAKRAMGKMGKMDKMGKKGY